LVVDDEPVVLRTAKLGLERHGFRVLDAGSGREALERIEREGAGVDLLLLDVTMAGMSGNEVLLEIERRGLRFPVLVSSGYPESEVLRELAGRRVAGFIQKPYTPARLAAAISGILRESTPLETRDPVRA